MTFIINHKKTTTFRKTTNKADNTAALFAKF